MTTQNKRQATMNAWPHLTVGDLRAMLALHADKPDAMQIRLIMTKGSIVELFGHTTLVGRIAEVERFGTKMLAIEPLFDDTLLGVVFHGGAAIYRLTPCSPAVAYAKQPTQGYQLPPSIRATLPDALLESSAQTIEPDDRHMEPDDDLEQGIDPL